MKEIWRVGRKVGRTVYREVDGKEELIGVMDTPELARQVVDAVNAALHAEPVNFNPNAGPPARFVKGEK